jgi:hypothetical protein
MVYPVVPTLFARKCTRDFPQILIPCQLNRSTQHFVEVYWREFEILRFFLDAGGFALG